MHKVLTDCIIRVYWYTCIFTADEVVTKTTLHKESAFVDEEEQGVQANDMNLEDIKTIKTTFNPLLKRQKHVVPSRPKSFCKENMLASISSDTNSSGSNFSQLLNMEKGRVIEGTQSLPRIYNLTINPSIDETIDVWT